MDACVKFAHQSNGMGGSRGPRGSHRRDMGY
jgi:hypothetical protein